MTDKEKEIGRNSVISGRTYIKTDMAFQRYKERRRDNALILLFDGIVILIIAIVLVLFNFCQ